MKLLVVLFLCIATGASAQVLVTYDGDTLKGDIKRMTEYDYYQNSVEKKAVYIPDKIKRLETAYFYDANDSLFVKWVVEFDNNGNITETRLYCNNDTPCKVITYAYDTQGREIKRYDIERFTMRCTGSSNWLENSVINWDLYYLDKTVFTSCKYEYDKAGRIIMKEEEGIIPGSDTTISITSYKYFTNNKIEQLKIQTKQVRPDYADTSIKVVDTEIDITNYKYDSNGNKIEENIRRIGNHLLEPDSVKSIFTYDSRNNLIEDKSYWPVKRDKNSTLHSGIEIGAGREYFYDSLNNQTMDIFYELYREDDGSETNCVLSTSTHDNDRTTNKQKEYDKHGNLIKLTVDGFVVFKREIEYNN